MFTYGAPKHAIHFSLHRRRRIVSLFAGLGGVLKPKSFAGLFGAASSVALLIWGLRKHRVLFRRRSR
jgi:hypothetical protein